MSGDGTVTAPDGSGRQVKVITADDVIAYLKAHPNFFTEHSELAGELGLVPRPQGPGVIDMQQAILKRLRSEIERLKTERTEIIANSKQNQIVQNRIQAAVLSIIQATTFEKMIHVVTHELPELLDVDFITLAIEANADAPKGTVEAYGDTKTQALSILKKFDKLLAAEGLTMGDVDRKSVV